MAELYLPNRDQRLDVFRRVWALSVLVLFGFTWKLWMPSPGFPQIPVVGLFGNLPLAVDWVLLAGIALSLLTIVLAPGVHAQQRAILCFAVALGVSMLINQHRFQPWAYQSLLIALVLAFTAGTNATKLLRWLVVSIYLWSAWSKCDFTFIHNLGQHLLQALLGWCGYQTWPGQVRLFLAGCISVAEFVIAVGLCVPSTRHAFVGISIVLHIMLLVALGPWGLQHKPGVLVWNLYFIAQNWLLFGGPRIVEAKNTESVRALRPQLVIAAAILWPIFEAWNYCDHWPAWSVYAPRVERTLVFVSQGEREKIPEILHAYLDPVSDDPYWLQLRLDRWSLDATDAPLYPQNRFQIGVAAAVARELGLSQSKIVRLSSANRLNGERQTKSFSGIGQLEQAASEYLLGTAVPRKWLRRQEAGTD